MLETCGVIDVHDLHAWTITSGVNVLSAQVVVTGEAASGPVLDHLGGCLADHFDIEHFTFQIEPPGHRDHEVDRARSARLYDQPRVPPGTSSGHRYTVLPGAASRGVV
jgi:hypothetical protein